MLKYAACEPEVAGTAEFEDDDDTDDADEDEESDCGPLESDPESDNEEPPSGPAPAQLAQDPNASMTAAIRGP